MYILYILIIIYSTFYLYIYLPLKNINVIRAIKLEFVRRSIKMYTLLQIFLASSCLLYERVMRTKVLI